MKTLNVIDVKEEDVLNRNEMKAIMAGSGSGPDCTCTHSSNGTTCQVTVDSSSSFGTRITSDCVGSSGSSFDQWTVGPNSHGTACGGECSW